MRKRVILLERDSVVRDMLARWLGKWGYEARVVRSAEEAADQARGEASPIAAVVADLDSGGATLHAKMQQQRPELAARFVFLAASEDRTRDPGVPLLTKPFQPVALLRALERLGGSHQGGA